MREQVCYHRMERKSIHQKIKMKTIFTQLLIILFAFAGYAQESFLSQCDFTKGNWEMYIIRGEGTEKEMKEVKNLYSNDNEEIEELLNNLIESRDSISRAFSNYTHEIVLILNGKIIETIALSNSDEKVNINDQYYNYDNEDFVKKSRKLKEIDKSSFTVDNKDKAIVLRKKLKNREGVYYRDYNDSVSFNYEGWLVFEVKFEERDFSNYEEQDSLEERFIRDNIEKGLNISENEYEFQFIRSTSKPDSDYRFESYSLYINKEMGEKFNQFTVLEKWKKIEAIHFLVYGMSFKEILMLID